MVDENNITPEVRQDFDRIQELYHQQTLEHPSESVLKTIRLKAQKATKPKRGIYWFLSWEKSVGFAVVFLIVAGLGVIFRQTEQEKTLTVSEITSAPPPPADFREVDPRFQPVALPQPKVVPAGFGMSTAKRISIQPATSIGKMRATPAPAAPGKDILTEEAGGEAEGVSADKDDDRKAKKVMALKKATNGYAPAALTTVPPGSQLNSIYKQALLFESQGKHLQATQAFQSIWTANPYYHQREDLLFHWAGCLSLMGQTKGALNRLALLEQINPSYPGLQKAKQKLKK